MARRVAFFTDSFHEINGVALTSREFVRFARRQSIPLLAVHAGPRTALTADGSVTTFEFKRGPVRWNLEHDLAIDFLFLRYRRKLWAALRDFQPELIHLTGPGDAGILGALAAWEFKLPLAASWHTNLHDFASARLSRALPFVPGAIRDRVAAWSRRKSLARCIWFYGLAKVLFAPNAELVEMLADGTRRPAFRMGRGIDTTLFSPMWRTRRDDAFVIGYVGRLSPEKNVRMLADIEHELQLAGLTNYRFLVIGEGSERGWLREHLKQAEAPGVLQGENLARAYASMDAFVFPSTTDTFGNVVLESMASGVPPVVSWEGGPKYLVEHGRTGYVAGSAEEFGSAILELYRDHRKHALMRELARRAAERFSWDAVLTDVHHRYESLFPAPAASAALAAMAGLASG